MSGRIFGRFPAWLRTLLVGWTTPKHRPVALIVSILVLGVIGSWLFSQLLGGDDDQTWEHIQQTGAWRVGMDPSFPPFDLLDSEGNPMGYDVDLARAIAARWGIQVEIVATGFDGLTDALMAGRIDSVISALPHDPRLTADLSYSSSYFEAGVRLAVIESSPISSVADLAGKRLAVEWGSNGDAEARRLQRDEPLIQRHTFSTPQEALGALLNGEADGILVDGVTLRQMQADGAGIVAVGPALESTPYVIAMPLGATMLQEEINAVLADFVATGFLDTLEIRWFSGGFDQ